MRLLDYGLFAYQTPTELAAVAKPAKVFSISIVIARFGSHLVNYSTDEGKDNSSFLIPLLIFTYIHASPIM
jgi:hypothetical protein